MLATVTGQNGNDWEGTFCDGTLLLPFGEMRQGSRQHQAGDRIEFDRLETAEDGQYIARGWAVIS